jgi:hypothetical protein
VLPLFYLQQLANSDRLGEVHYFIQEESVGSQHYFHSALSVLNHFRNFKMAESCFFLHKIQSRGNKTSPSLP